MQFFVVMSSLFSLCVAFRNLASFSLVKLGLFVVHAQVMDHLVTKLLSMLIIQGKAKARLFLGIDNLAIISCRKSSICQKFWNFV